MTTPRNSTKPKVKQGERPSGYPIFHPLTVGERRAFCAEFPTNCHTFGSRRTSLRLITVINLGVEPRASSSRHCQTRRTALPVQTVQVGWWYTQGCTGGMVVYPGVYSLVHTRVVHPALLPYPGSTSCTAPIPGWCISVCYIPGWCISVCYIPGWYSLLLTYPGGIACSSPTRVVYMPGC